MARTVDPLYAAAARLSHATRKGEPPDVILGHRRELAGAQLERFLTRLIEAGTPPTMKQSQAICAMLLSATTAVEAA